MAILGVVFHHLYGEVFIQGENIFLFGFMPVSPFTLFSNSYQGVALFFLLSGFVLTLPYAQKRRTMSSYSDIFQFYRRRAIRLLPLYFFSLLVGFVFIAPPVDVYLFIKKLLLYATGAFTFTEDYFFPEINFVLWSLGLEILFSLLFPFIVILMQKLGVWRVLISLCILALTARFFGLFLIMIRSAELFSGTTTPIFNSIFCRIDDFAFGMGLAILYVHKPKFNTALCYSLGAVFLVVGFSLRDMTMSILPLIFLPITNSFINLGFFLLIAIMLLQPNRIWKLIIENSALQLIGLMCYSIFIWHGMFLIPLQATAGTYYAVRYLMFVLIVSFLTYRYIECGWRKQLRDILPSKSSEA